MTILKFVDDDKRVTEADHFSGVGRGKEVNGSFENLFEWGMASKMPFGKRRQGLRCRNWKAQAECTSPFVDEIECKAVYGANGAGDLATTTMFDETCQESAPCAVHHRHCQEALMRANDELGGVLADLPQQFSSL